MMMSQIDYDQLMAELEEKRKDAMVVKYRGLVITSRRTLNGVRLYEVRGSRLPGGHWGLSGATLEIVKRELDYYLGGQGDE